MLVNLGGEVSLSGTIGCSTVQVGKCRCVSFVRGPAQLSSSGSFVDQSQQATTTTSSASSGTGTGGCSSGNVALTLVRAPFATRSGSSSSSSSSSGEASFGKFSDSHDGSLVATVQKAIDHTVIHEKLPLARFELVTQILSSADDESDFQAVTAAVCAALVDAAIPMHDIFGASSSSSSGRGTVSVIVSAHTGGVLAMHSFGPFSPESLCSSVERCCAQAKQQTLDAFQSAAVQRLNTSLLLLAEQASTTEQEAKKNTASTTTRD